VAKRENASFIPLSPPQSHSSLKVPQPFPPCPVCLLASFTCTLYPPPHLPPQRPRPVALGTHIRRPRRLPHRPRRCGTGGSLRPRVWRDAVRVLYGVAVAKETEVGGERGHIRPSARRCRRRGTGHRRHSHGGAGSGGSGGSGGGGSGGGRWLAGLERMAPAMDGVGAFSVLSQPPGGAAVRRTLAGEGGG